MNREIIQQLLGEMQEVFAESFEEVIKAKNYAEFNKAYASKAIPILLKALGKFYEHLDDYIRQSDWRIRNGYIVKDNIKKSILTSLGYIEYTKTIYKDRDGYIVCLLDDYVGLKPKERMMDDARERILEDVIDSSYRKAGIVASILDSVHKQTVKNLIMETEVPKLTNISKDKKVVDVLYIEADEDHVALQDKFKKKEYITDKNGKKRKKKNTIIDKLVYCFEGKELEAPISKRKRLINPHYFAGVYKGTNENGKLWEEVYEYISSRYDLEKVKKIYISGDGASWIREGLNYFKQAVFVMDEYHILKYTIKATSVLQDSQEEGIHRIFVALRNNDKTEMENIFGLLYNACKTGKEREAVNECYKYFMDGFKSICLRFQKNEEILGCSAEGHISHILSNRLSSRPMGWSIKGCNNISKLIAYHYNGGSIAKLLERNRHRVLNYNIINFKEAKEECIKNTKQEMKIKKPIKKSGVDPKYYNAMQAELTEQGKILKYMGKFY